MTPAPIAAILGARSYTESVVDVLSDVLQAVRLSGSLFFTAEMKSAWAAISPPREVLAEAIGTDPDWIVLFHLVAEGRCYVELDSDCSAWLEAGDILIMPQAGEHFIASTAEDVQEPTSVSELLADLPPSEGPARLRFGEGDHVTTSLVCGYLEADEQFEPLAGALPRLLCVRTGQRGPSIETVDGGGCLLGDDSETGPWLDTSLRYAMHEANAGRSGAVSMLGRLAELLFVQVLRSYMEQVELTPRGWLAGLRDPHVGRALQLLHERPEHQWTVDELGRRVGLSRSALGERFTRMLDEPPMRYLASWRMQLARRLMRDSGLSVSEVARRVGYDSEAAFHRAFKRDRGEPPATWRKRQLQRAER